MDVQGFCLTDIEALQSIQCLGQEGSAIALSIQCAHLLNSYSSKSGAS